MAAAVPVGLEGLKDRVKDYRDQLASLDRAMSALRDYADNLLDAIERDCLALQSAPTQPAEDPVSEPAATSGPQLDDCADGTCEVGSICAEQPAAVHEHIALVAAAPVIPHPTALPTGPDDFTLIKGIDHATADVLAGLGLTRFADLARLYPEDVAEIGLVLADSRRINRECWIEQAAILAAGHSTEFVRQMARAVPGPAVAAPSATSVPEAAQDRWAPCFAPLQSDDLPATGPEFALAPPRETVDIEAQLAEARAAVARSRRTGNPRRPPPNLSGARQRARQKTLAEHRSSRAGWKLALTSAAALSLAVISGSFVASSTLQSELAARLTRLGMCTVESIPTDHDCAVLAWLSL